MNRKPACRSRRTPTLEALEGRDVPSGLGALPQGASLTSALLPYIEQDNVYRAPASVAHPTTPTGGGPAGIIAILIG